MRVHVSYKLDQSSMKSMRLRELFTVALALGYALGTATRQGCRYSGLCLPAPRHRCILDGYRR
jgi:hypothetical protein